MQKTRLLCAVLCLALLLSIPAAAFDDPFAVRTALSTPETRHCVVSMRPGEVLSFSAEDLELHMELGEGELQGVTITSLPPLSQGGLFLDGVEVEAYDYLEREAIDRLCFAASEVASGAMIGLMPQAKDGVSTILTVKMLERDNRAPVIENAVLETMQNVSASGRFTASDPDGDAVSIRIVQAPSKGVVAVDGLGFRYEPFLDKTGADSFTVRAVDEHGAYSQPAVISVDIERVKSGFSYVDMNGSPSEYAAIKLRESGVFSGQQIGSSWFFEPDERMTRGELLVMLLAAAGMEDSITATVNTGLPNDAEIPFWLKRYVAKAVEEGILSPDLPFHHADVPTRAEAVVLTDRAAKISDVKEYPLTTPDADGIPQWARSAYRDLAAYKMLDLYEGYAHPDRLLTNAYAADLVWQLYKHTHR